MARVARVVVPGCMHHVTQRGNHRQAVFFGDADRRVYLSTLWDSAARHGLEVIGHCLMSNHVHLLVVPQKEDSLAKTLARVSNAYARWQHVRQQQTGHLWQDRYYSCALDQAAAWEALRYVELNPVRAGLVRRAWEWEWSSARAHSCGRDEGGRLEWRRWRERWCADSWREALEIGFADAALQERIREATRSGRPLGSEGFVAGIERDLGRKLRPQKRGRKASAAAVAGQLKLGKE